MPANQRTPRATVRRPLQGSVQGSRQASANRGVLLMAVAMLSIPIVDALAKHLSDSFSPLFISWARYAIASLIVVPIAALRLGPRILPAKAVASHFARTACLVCAMTLYFLSIATTPLATAISTYFIGPVVGLGLAVVRSSAMSRSARYQAASLS